MWLTLLAIIALTITTSQCHDEQDQNVVKTITDQDIDTNRVRRFVTGTGYPNKPGYLTTQNKTNGYNVSTTRSNRNNTTQRYASSVQNYNYSKPGYYLHNVNTSNIKPVYSKTAGYRQYPGNYSKNQGPLPRLKNIVSKHNASSPKPAQNNSSRYPVSNITKPRYTQFPGNNSGYPAQQNRPTPNAPWTRPVQNNTGYPVFNATKPGYNNPVKYDKCRGMDACVITASNGCPEGMTKFGEQCVQDSDE